MQILGTHPHLNHALGKLVEGDQSIHAAGLYVIDADHGYGAPIASMNRAQDSEDTYRYVENFHRTRLDPSRSAAVRFGLDKKSDKTNYSRHFNAHRLSHTALAHGNMVLQYVGVNTSPPAAEKDSEAYKTLQDIAKNVTDYQVKQGLHWADIFGLRPDRKQYNVTFIDINGYSNFSFGDRAKLETAIIRTASDFEAETGVEAFQVIGDEVRFRSPSMSKEAVITMVDDFTSQLRLHAKIESVSTRAASSRGYISDIFVGDPNDLLAQKAFNGAVLTRIGNTIKTMNRNKKLVFC